MVFRFFGKITGKYIKYKEELPNGDNGNGACPIFCRDVPSCALWECGTCTDVDSCQPLICGVPGSGEKCDETHRIVSDPKSNLQTQGSNLVKFGEYGSFDDGGDDSLVWAECCVDGACVGEETPTCTDDDGGVEGEQYNVKGIAGDGTNLFEDGCIVALGYEIYVDEVPKPIDSCNADEFNNGLYSLNEKPCIIKSHDGVVDCIGSDCFLFEAICKDPQTAGGMYYNCPYGCSDGKCVTQETYTPHLQEFLT